MAEKNKESGRVEYSAEELNEATNKTAGMGFSGDAPVRTGDLKVEKSLSRASGVAKPPAFRMTTSADEAKKFIKSEDVAKYGSEGAESEKVTGNTSVVNATNAGIAIMDDPETAARVQGGLQTNDLIKDMWWHGHETPISGDDLARIRNYRSGSPVANTARSANRTVDPRTF